MGLLRNSNRIRIGVKSHLSDQCEERIFENGELHSLDIHYKYSVVREIIQTRFCKHSH